MSDILSRLRELAGAARHWGYREDAQIMVEAADRIEQLEQRLDELTRLAQAVVESYDKPGVTLLCSAIEQLRAYFDAQEAHDADD